MSDIIDDTRCDCDHWRGTRRRCEDCPDERRKWLNPDGLQLEIPNFLRSMRNVGPVPNVPPRRDRCCDE